MKYGYLTCDMVGSERQRRGAGPLDLFTEGVRSVPAPCTPEQVAEAIKKFQATSKRLQATGELDEPTLDLMRKQRCGNTDKNIIPPSRSVQTPRPSTAVSHETAAAPNTNTSSTVSTSGDAHAHGDGDAPGDAGDADGDTTGDNTSSHSIKRRAVEIIAQRKQNRLKTRLKRQIQQHQQQQQQQQDLSRIEEQTTKQLRQTNHAHAPGLLDFSNLLLTIEEDTEVHPHQQEHRKKRERRSLLQNILNPYEPPKFHPMQHRLDQLEAMKQSLMNVNITELLKAKAKAKKPIGPKPAPSQPRTRKNRKLVYVVYDDEPDPVVNKTETGGHEYEVRRVRRGVEDVLENARHQPLHRFATSAVSWMLHDQSTLVPLRDQIRLLQLAFRMWSEVIPLVFHCGGPTMSDIMVSFHKGELGE